MRPIIKPLTSARFFAALLVVIFHYDKKLLIFPAGLADFGYEAVTFFFILSGFVLTYTHGGDDGLNVSVSQFARSRLLRIAPSYFLALIVAAPFVVAAALKAGHLDVENTLVPLMLQSWWPPAALLWNSPAWSLSNEIFFYALYPAIWWAWSRLDSIISLTMACALVLAVATIRSACPDISPAWHNFAAYFPLLNLPQFVLGVTLGKLFLSKGPTASSNSIFLASISALILVICFKVTQPWLSNNIILCAVFGAMIYAVGGLKSISLAIFSMRWLVVLGEASYAIYILHVPIWTWWDRVARVLLDLNLPPTLDFSLYLGCVLSISVIAMAYFERPMRGWLRRNRPLFIAT